MPDSKPAPLHQHWPRSQFLRFRSCVGYVSGRDAAGDACIGTCFHVGEGVFVTARHVVEALAIEEVGFDDHEASCQLVRDPAHWGPRSHGMVSITSGPHFHPDPTIDVACFRTSPYPDAFIPLGGHLDDFLTQYELVLDRTLVLGYPRIPMADRAVLVASLGEVNAVVDKYIGRHPHFVISTIARGGFSGAPVLVGYNEANEDRGTAALGIVTESLTFDGAPVESGYMAVLSVEPIYDCLGHHGMIPACQMLDFDTDA